MGQQILLIVHILLALAIIGLILLQQGKGSEVGAAFGSGASQTLFGSRGSASFLTKLTALLAIGFAITSLSMGYITNHKSNSKSILKVIEEVQKAKEVPTLPADAAATDTQEEDIDNTDNKITDDVPKDVLPDDTVKEDSK
jgi:preprotein translocase subunit SecG